MRPVVAISWMGVYHFIRMMSKKAMVHLGILGALIIYTMFAWHHVKSSREDAKEAAKEARENGTNDPWEDLKQAEGSSELAEDMIKVGIPLLVAVIYAGVLAVLYVLPSMVDRVSEEMMGSTAEVDDDPLDEARDAVEEGEYPEAIAVYRKFWLENPGKRLPILEIAKIQREHLESPAAAISTLEEGLEEHDWEEDDAAFLMFRIAEIYEEDLDDREKVTEMMERVMKELEGTRHAGNAAQKLRELPST